MQTVRLADAVDLGGFRAAARGLLARGVSPQAVQWETDDAGQALLQVRASAQGGLLGSPSAGEAQPALEFPPGEAAGPLPPAAPVRVPAAFVTLCESVVLHADARRFDLLYRLLWRLAHEPRLRDDPLDADWLQAQRMAKAVQRELHKMRAFVRFRPVADREDPQDLLHVAWFEPEHHIVEANADWFRRRFANVRWAILTPARCVEWNGQALRFGPGARRDEAPAPDAGEQLWLTYYRSTFNPARLKVQAMAREMPRRYWRNLPEAQLIAPLVADALARSGAMLEASPTTPARRLPRPLPMPSPAAVTGLPALAAAQQSCRACPLWAQATQAVPGEGPPAPRLMLVGEQPGDQEDLAGRPFVGPAGRLLDRALAEAGIARDSVYLTNAVRHFRFELRGKRRIHKTPGQQEVAACSRWLEEELALVRPAALVALGATAARALLGHPVAVGSAHGQWFTRADGLRVLVTWHPSALLRAAPQAHEAAYAKWVADLVRAAQGADGVPAPGG